MPVSLLIDTGAPINVIDEVTYAQLKSKPLLERCKTKYFGVGGVEPISLLGQFTTDLSFNESTVRAGFIVVRGRSQCLLSFSASTRLGIVRISDKAVSLAAIEEDKTSADPRTRLSVEQLKLRFPSAFSGRLGCVRGHKVSLEVDPEVRPVRQRLRPIAIHLREAVSRELDEQVRARTRRQRERAYPMDQQPCCCSKGPHKGASWRAAI